MYGMEKIDNLGTWSANETVYNAGSMPQFIYLVIDGSAKITAPNGYYLGDVGQDELFGEASFVLGTKLVPESMVQIDMIILLKKLM